MKCREEDRKGLRERMETRRLAEKKSVGFGLCCVMYRRSAIPTKRTRRRRRLRRRESDPLCFHTVTNAPCLKSFMEMIGERNWSFAILLLCHYLRMRSLILLLCIASIALCSSTSIDKLLKSVSEKERYSAMSSNSNPLCMCIHLRITHSVRPLRHELLAARIWMCTQSVFYEE